MKIDPQRSVAWLEKRIAEEKNPRHRAMIENYKQHLYSEVTADLPAIMATLVDEPVYHSYTGQALDGRRGPKNSAEVKAFYNNMFTTRVNVLERHVDRMIVTDDFLVSEGSIDQAFPGEALLAGGRTTDASGAPIEPGAYYQTSYRICAVLPYIGEGTDVRMAGEDTYTLVPANDLRRIAPDEIPDLLR